MQNGREKKVPINIKDLKKEQGQEKHEKGEISYLGKSEGGGGKGPTTSSKAKLNYTQLAIAVGLSVLIAVIIGNFFYASQDDALTLLDNQILLETNQAETNADLATESGRIENIIANYATKSELSGYATTSQLEGLATASALDSLKSLVLGHGSGITSLESLTEDHETRITELEASVNGTTVIGGGSYDYYLTSNEGDPWLHVRSSRSGLFNFRLTLVPEDPVVFMSIVDVYDACGTYTPEVIKVGTEWKVLRLSYLYGTRSLDANEWKEGPLLALPSYPFSGDYDVFIELLPGTASEDSGGHGGF